MATALIEREQLTNEERRDRVSAATKVHRRALDTLAQLDKKVTAETQAALKLATLFLDAEGDEIEETRAKIYRQRTVIENAQAAVRAQQIVEVDAWNALCIARMR